MDLHDTELQSIEEQHRNSELNLQSVIAQLRVDYEQLVVKQQHEQQKLESAFAVERKDFTGLVEQLRQKLQDSKEASSEAVQKTKSTHAKELAELHKLIGSLRKSWNLRILNNLRLSKIFINASRVKLVIYRNLPQNCVKKLNGVKFGMSKNSLRLLIPKIVRSSLFIPLLKI